MTQEVLKVSLPRPVQSFDYLPLDEGDLKTLIGKRVLIPFGRKELVGFVVGVGQASVEASKLKPIIQVLDESPLFDGPLFELIKKAANYYHHPIGDVLATGLPKPIKEGKPLNPDIKEGDGFQKGLGIPFEHTLTPEQNQAIECINQSESYNAFLLHGVTGSGKTEVYLQCIQHKLAQRKNVLVLLPEIGLTPQTFERFKERLECDIFLVHSRLTPVVRAKVWAKVKASSGCVVLGTRSALFAPMSNIGLIMVDEEHDASFKQQDGFRYCARNMSVLRARLEDCPVVLGSATPSFETLHNVQMDKYQKLSLPTKIAKHAQSPIEIIDVRHNKLEGGLSPILKTHIDRHLEQDGQVLLFLNRRGYAPTYMCFECSHMIECSACDAKMIVHRTKHRLECHHCGRMQAMMEQCPKCANPMSPVGVGTQRVEQALSELYGEDMLLRIDSDTTRKKGELAQKLELIQSGQAKILIGTQLMAKGHHFPKLSLVVIVDVDSGLFSGDFRAIEHMGQLITQVAGRAGRAQRAGQVLMQSAQPEHPLLKILIEQGYDEFAKVMLKEREDVGLPPFTHMAMLRSEAKKSGASEQFLSQIKESIPMWHVLARSMHP